MGQQILQTSASKPMRAWSHVKILNRVFKSTPDIPSETERNQLNFSASGMPLFLKFKIQNQPQRLANTRSINLS